MLKVIFGNDVIEADLENEEAIARVLNIFNKNPKLLLEILEEAQKEDLTMAILEGIHGSVNLEAQNEQDKDLSNIN